VVAQPLVGKGRGFYWEGNRNETFQLPRMSKLIYIANTSLDGYVEDETGAFDWVNPDQVHEFVTELLRPIGTYLYGRRLYETMAYFGGPVIEDYPPEHRDFARVWQKAEKIVFSRTLQALRQATRVSNGTSTLRLFGSSNGNRSATSTLAAPSLRGLRSRPISSTNVTYFFTR